MRKRLTALTALLMLGVLAAPYVRAQVTDVTVREIQSLSPDAINALNAAGTALTEQEILVWTLTQDSISVSRIALSRKAITTKVKQYLQKLQEIQPIEKESVELFQQLVAPALSQQITKKRYMGIVPHGILHYLPWAALSNAIFPFPYRTTVPLGSIARL